MSIPEKFRIYNSQQTKNISIVVKIEGVKDVLTNRPIYTRVRYGDPGLKYGEPGLVYGGLRRYVTADGGTYRDYLSLENSTLSISQKLEPEEGRSSFSLITLSFVDIDNWMSNLIAIGVEIDEILGREVEVYLGYSEISFPEDYVKVFRGRIQGVQAKSGLVTLTLSDPFLKLKSEAVKMPLARLAQTLTEQESSKIILDSNAGFYLGFNVSGTSIKQFVQLNDEWIEANINPLTSDELTIIKRGARDTEIAEHEEEEELRLGIEIEGHAIDLALQFMLSGASVDSANPFAGWIEGIPFESVGRYPDNDPLVERSNSIQLPVGIDAVRDYGLTLGDTFTLKGLVNEPSANNVICTITGFETIDDQENRVINFATQYLDSELTTRFSIIKENAAATGATISFRSKYAILPKGMGIGLTPLEVDVPRIEEIRNTFRSAGDYRMRFFLDRPITDLKAFIERELLRPIGCYSLTRRGKISIGITKPPIADQRLKVLNKDNILNPLDIAPTRGLSSRTFYNKIRYFINRDDEGEFKTWREFEDEESQELTGIESILEIESAGIKSDIFTDRTLDRISRFTLSRYKRGAITFNVEVNWEVGSEIECGDVVAVEDNGGLKLTDFETGRRDLGVKLYEIVDRRFDMRTGRVTLGLVAGVGAEATDRYATISPSSKVREGSTRSEIIIGDSYGAVFPMNERLKWIDYIGQKILIHSDDWSFSEEVTFRGFSETNRNALVIEPELSVDPLPSFIVDIPHYPDDPDPTAGQIYKVIHAHLTPTVTVVSGVDSESFTVPAKDMPKFKAGQFVRVHKEDYSQDSGDIEVISVVAETNTVTVEDMGYTPEEGDLVDLIGFPDGGGPYRWV